MNPFQEKKSSDLFLRSDAGTEKIFVQDFQEETEHPGKPSPFARLETLERFIFANNCPPFSLVTLEVENRKEALEKLIPHLEAIGIPDKILVVREKKNRFLILLKDKDAEATEAFIRFLMKPFNDLSFFAGVFSHPLKGFSAGSSLWNAQKAMKHSMLTGPNSIVSFDAVSLNISGDDAWQEGNILEAMREYEAALALDPRNSNVLNSLGVCFAARNEFDRAIESFVKSAESDPDEAMPVYNRGLIHEMRGEREKALENFEKAMLLAPESFEIFFHAGKTHMDSKNLEKALPLLEKAHSLKPAHGPALTLLAECFLAGEKCDEAFRFFRKAQQRMPGNPQVLSGLGFCFFKKNEDLDIAATFCEEALALEPENALFALRLARILEREGKEEEALPLLLRARNAGLALLENEQIFLRGIEESSA